jgi:hypothetical protein
MYGDDRYDPQRDPEARRLAEENARRRSVAPTGRTIFTGRKAILARRRVDPTSILDEDEEPSERELTYYGDDTLGLSSIAAQKWLLQVAVEEFQALQRTIDRVSAQLRISAEEAAVEDFARKLRHGRAATCPRHGTTRGGTCLKCARGV